MLEVLATSLILSLTCWRCALMPALECCVWFDGTATSLYFFVREFRDRMRWTPRDPRLPAGRHKYYLLVCVVAEMMNGLTWWQLQAYTRPLVMLAILPEIQTRFVRLMSRNKTCSAVREHAEEMFFTAVTDVVKHFCAKMLGRAPMIHPYMMRKIPSKQRILKSVLGGGMWFKGVKLKEKVTRRFMSKQRIEDLSTELIASVEAHGLIGWCEPRMASKLFRVLMDSKYVLKQCKNMGFCFLAAAGATRNLMAWLGSMWFLPSMMLNSLLFPRQEGWMLLAAARYLIYLALVGPGTPGMVIYYAVEFVAWLSGGWIARYLLHKVSDVEFRRALHQHLVATALFFAASFAIHSWIVGLVIVCGWKLGAKPAQLMWYGAFGWFSGYNVAHLALLALIYCGLSIVTSMNRRQCLRGMVIEDYTAGSDKSGHESGNDVYMSTYRSWNGSTGADFKISMGEISLPSSLGELLPSGQVMSGELTPSKILPSKVSSGKVSSSGGSASGGSASGGSASGGSASGGSAGKLSSGEISSDELSSDEPSPDEPSPDEPSSGCNPSNSTGFSRSMPDNFLPEFADTTVVCVTELVDPMFCSGLE